MEIRFKFRSSVTFDSIQIGNRSSISLRDLKSMIIQQKHLNISQDLDLVLSDSLTGKEYDDENSMVPGGSSVIIRRVPAGSAPHSMPHIDSVKKFVINDATIADNVGYPSAKGELENFDDFGADLCPVPEATSVESDLDINQMNWTSDENMNKSVPSIRCSDLPMLGCQNLEAINHRPRHDGTELNEPQAKFQVDEERKLGIVVDARPTAMNNIDLPSELKCSVCKNFFKQAVMIPCCQHSFCEKCIRQVLVEKARCPKCFSTKCRVEDLLPNLSLRQAIEHFLESQAILSASDNVFPRYAPDGESGIQAKDVSYAPTIIQRGRNFSHSPSATGKGSNQMMAESVYNTVVGHNAPMGLTNSHIIELGSGKSVKSGPLAHKIENMDGGKDNFPKNPIRGPEDFVAVTDFQGENQPNIYPQTGVPEEVKLKRGSWTNTAGGHGGFIATGRNRKGDRTCYMCGSRDHFIRDCPAASIPHPMQGEPMFPVSGTMPGFVPSYWSRPMLPQIGPYANMYGNSGMMPFNTNVVPVRPFAVPPYISPMYAGSPVPGGFMRMGGLTPPVGTSMDGSQSHSAGLELQNYGKRPNHFSESKGRKPYRDDDDDGDYSDDYDKPSHHVLARRYDRKPHIDSDKSLTYSGDSFSRKSPKKHSHDEHKYEKSLRYSTSDRDPRPSYPERSHSGERNNHRHRSPKTHQLKKDLEPKKRRVESDNRYNHKKHSHSGSGLEPSSSSDWDRIKQHKERDSSHVSRHSRHSPKPIDKLSHHDRWHNHNGSDQESGEDHHRHKRKRAY